MNDKQKEEVLSAIKSMVVPDFEPYSITECNWRVDGQPGHPFMIGTKHVAYAHDHCSGMLGADVCEKIGCAMKGCGRPASVHTHDTVLILRLTKTITHERAKELLTQKELETLLNMNKIDGFTFLETKEKFRILPAEVKQ